ncbi:MAG TPA: hypothetical protein VHX38_41235 [Pseudonocardiaceae bacterium]|jgi:hypothetical protein|nr:hypothetical protein [Pseudonocardiaceae bacterium]
MSQLPDSTRPRRPLTSGQQQRLHLATRRLSELLIEAAPLIELLNADQTPHRFRAALTEVLGMRRFAVVLGGLKAMNCRSASEHAHRPHPKPNTP